MHRESGGHRAGPEAGLCSGKAAMSPWGPLGAPPAPGGSLLGNWVPEDQGQADELTAQPSSREQWWQEEASGVLNTPNGSQILINKGLSAYAETLRSLSWEIIESNKTEFSGKRDLRHVVA